MKGVQPVLRLTTKDGAIFQNSDPISLAFAENSAIASTVLEWIMPPLAQRYMETCAQTKTSTFQSIRCVCESHQPKYKTFLENLIIYSNNLYRC